MQNNVENRIAVKGPEKSFTYNVERYTMEQIKDISPIEFWCNQFAEHALMIMSGLVGGREEIDIIIKNSKIWYEYWKSIDYNNLIEIKDGAELFIQFKINLLELMKTEWTGYLLPAIIKHMIDEVTYFMSYIDGTVLETHEKDIKFWVKHHEEFSTIFSKILDPSSDIQTDVDLHKLYFKENSDLIGKTFLDQIQDKKSEEKIIMQFINDTRNFEEFIYKNVPKNLFDVIYPMLINHDYNEVLFSLREIDI